MTNSKHLIKKVAIISGLMLGGFAIAALAASWTPPTAQPPENNVDAPINVGSSPQGKVGRLGLGQAQPRVGAAVLDVLGAGVIDNLFANTFTLTSGSPENGKVLTATNNNGLATWTDLDDINDPIDSCDLIAESSVVLQHFEAVTIPASCLNGTCHLHMATYNSAGDVVSLKSASLVQFTDSAKTAKGTLAQWWAKSGAGADGTTCKAGKNGAAGGCDEILHDNRGVDAQNNSQDIWLKDDGNLDSNDPTKWSFTDNASNHSAKLYICK